MNFRDLSFNNLFGNLLPFIFNIPTLQSMSLSNNKFLGYLPDKKSDNLTMIDLSNNELEGRIPEWNKEVSLLLVDNQISLEECQKYCTIFLSKVINIFKEGLTFLFDSFFHRIQPRGLECLQKTTKCFVGKDLFTSFAINCGGEKIRSSDGKTIFEADNIDNNASYYVADNNQWAVTFGLLQLIYFTKDITNNLDPKLYRSSRKSSTTLKYYGLGLEIGNYTIDLMFSNVDNGDDDTYAFDIYIQGILRDRNFEILKEKGALNKSYVVPVTENTKNMEISFIPNQAIGSKVLISAIKVYADFEDGIDQKKGSTKKSSMKKSTVTGNIQYLEGAPIHAAANKEFTYLELVTMTSNFNRIIGKGGFGNVYHGIDQRNGSQVAVKVQILTRIHHKNFVSLVGYCIDSGHLALVYEYVERGCLKNLISGLNYLHRECQPAIVHRDVKTTNILLTRDYEVKIADFGSSKVFENGANDAMSTIVMGTFGYIDPEYYRIQKLNEKSDVYSFGIVLIELITGQPAVINQEGERIPIATLVKPKLERGEIDEILDPKLNGEYNTNSAKKALEIAFTCIHPTSSERPLMFDVVKQLKECLEFEIPQGSTSTKSIDYNNLDITAPFAR
ncbi:hypothetical protein ZOSMA_217G00130 [Zostera marina]|uniref:non-specific serine/threonine protein kinase n=1 Tax=Zostera marina TaxID=29655 RepID=A0A0K9PJT8_ZOSMR|nr:hypothetical protein ZOSMA_217G00130 [Zostera marina]